MPEYDKLIADLDNTLAKAAAVEQAEDDAKIKAAAKDADQNGKDTEGAKAGDKDEVFGKSFAVTLEDGTEVEAFDGTAMLKSLTAIAKGQAAEIASLKGELAKSGEIAERIVPLLKSLQTQVEQQGELIKALRESPAPRRGVVENPKPKVEDEKTFTRGELLTKSLAASSAGRITSHEAAMVETYLNNGMAVPEHLLGRITAA